MSSIAIAATVFVIGGIATSVTQRRYFEALAKVSDAVSSDQTVLNDMLARPSRVPVTSAHETSRRLHALVSRKSDPELELRRVLAIVAILLTIGSFLWILLAITLGT